MTNEQFGVAGNLAALLKQGDPAAADLLCEDVVYQNLGLELSGRGNVSRHLLGEHTGRLYRSATWAEPVAHADAVLIVARSAANSALDDKIVLLHFRDAQVCLIQEQLLLPLPSPAQTPLKIDAELRRMINSALETRNPMVVAFVDELGQPTLSFRGSVHVIADDQLAMWVRNSRGRFIRAIGSNPRVALMYRNEDKRATFQLHGRARIAGDEQCRRRVFDALPKVERDHDFARLGCAVIVEIDRIEGYAGVADGRVIGAVNMCRSGIPSTES